MDTNVAFGGMMVVVLIVDLWVQYSYRWLFGDEEYSDGPLASGAGGV